MKSGQRLLINEEYRVHETTDLRKLRGESRTGLEKTEKLHEKLLANEDIGLQLQVLATALNQQDDLSALGGLALVSATHELKAMKRRIDICSYAIYILGFLVVASGICAAVLGLKVESGDA